MGLWRQLSESLEHSYSAAVTRLTNVFRPRGADKVLRILHGLAMIDDQLDERELAFITAFAKRWGFKLDDALLHDRGQAHPVEERSYTSLRDAMNDYLATGPQPVQANHLRDVLTSLGTIDGRICEREELVLEELGRMIDSYVGHADPAGYVVFIAPRSEAQAAAMTEKLPAFKREARPDGDVFRVGHYHSQTYAQLVCGWYDDAGYRTSVEQSP